MTVDQVPLCRTGCGRPAVATLTTNGSGGRFRIDRLTDPATAAAWSPILHCLECLLLAIAWHIITAGRAPAGSDGAR